VGYLVLRSVARAFPFFIAYLIPGTAALGLAKGGWWTFSGVVLVFVLTPVLDLLVGHNRANPPELEGPRPQRNPVFDLALWLWVPTQLSLIAWGLWSMATQSLAPFEVLGVTLSVGISSGAGGINVAHELMHRHGRWERALAEILMTSAVYPHFCIEHVRGHHRDVATPQDPASARAGESIARFLPRTLFGSLASAWRIESERVARRGRGLLGLGDRRLRYAVIVAAVVAATMAQVGPGALLFFLGQGLVAVLLLEIINHVEHYGLERRLLPSGRYERVTPRHSWNASHRLTNWYLFNLQRHADHHDMASRPYWLLRHVPDCPQLPAGYATMCLVALVPPLWGWMMDPKVAEWRQRSLQAEAQG
jgi:alkane 1-monooxygenase